jgi:hypothetical protein
MDYILWISSLPNIFHRLLFSLSWVASVLLRALFWSITNLISNLFPSLRTTNLLTHKFNVFHVRVLYYTKNINHQQMRKEFFINCNTFLHVSTLLGHLQGEISVVVTLRLPFTFERECAVDYVLRCFLRRELFVVSACTAHVQSTAHSRSTVKCNLSVTKTESSLWRWPSRVETCRSVLQLMKKLFVHLLVINVFCY